MPRPTLFVNREKEIQYFSETLRATDVTQSMCIWGLPGVGKSALLRIFENTACEQDFAVYVGSMKGETYISWFNLIFGFAVVPTPGVSLEKLATHKFLSNITGRTLLILDDYPEDAQEIDSAFSLLLEQAKWKKKMVFLIVSSRALPYIKDSVAFRLNGLSSREVEDFIHLAAASVPGWIQETKNYIEQISQRTSGNPQLIRLLCTNPQAWGNFLKDESSTLSALYPRLMFQEIWTHLDARLQEALYALTAMSVVSPTVFSEACIELIHDWNEIANSLERKCLIERLGPAEYKLHDLIRDFVQVEHSLKVAQAHNRAGDYYVSHTRK